MKLNPRKNIILKKVELPPYSSVKISSYANWIKSFRRQSDGSTANFWRTMDSEFVKYVMKRHGFNGNVRKELFDTVYGDISGYLRASVGLESVFMAKEQKLNKKLV